MKVFIARPPGYDNPHDVFPFVRSLLTWFDREGIAYTPEPESGEDIALSIQWVPGLEIVESLHRRGVPFVHRLDGRARALVKNYDADEENRRINALAEWTVFQSQYVRDHTTRAQDTIFGREAPICVNPTRGSIIYNGVDTEIFSHQGQREDLEGEFRILHVAFSAGVRKGVGDLVRIAELLRNNSSIRFYTIGRQDQDVAFGRHLSMLPNVTQLGVIVDRERLSRLMRSCHALLFSSRGDYCPNTVLEAMSCGLPVIYHPSGGTPELVVADELSAGIPMMEENPVYPIYVAREFQEELSRRAVEVVRRRFTLERMGRDYAELFQRILESRGKAAA